MHEEHLQFGGILHEREILLYAFSFLQRRSLLVRVNSRMRSHSSLAGSCIRVRVLSLLARCTTQGVYIHCRPVISCYIKEIPSTSLWG